MALSSRASAFLAGFSRKPHVASRSTMESIFESVNIPIYAPILAFQQDYAGYRLVSHDFPGLTCGIVQHKPKPISGNPISRMLQIAKPRIKRHYNDYRVEDYHFHAMRYENKWFFGCTEDTFEGINYIDEEGKLWHSIWNWSGKYDAPWLRTSSMDKYIERVAFWRTACLSDEGWQQLRDVEKKHLDWNELAVTWNLVKDEDASDATEQVWCSETLVARITGNFINFWCTPHLDTSRRQYLWSLRVS